MTQNEFNLLYAIKKNGISSIRKISRLANVSVGYASQKINSFIENEFIVDGEITNKGLMQLAPYKVKNAVIMAAGAGSHFAPMSFEKPKGLLSVKNEVLIERQITQLQDAGIKEIIIIVGYKKEAFFYLETKYEGIKFIINPEYINKNNSYTLFLTQKFLENTYICSSDDYFEENPFEEYVYESFYSGVKTEDKLNEWYMSINSKGYISHIEKAGTKGYVMLGHAYWDREFSRCMKNIFNDQALFSQYEQSIWEQILADKLKELPAVKMKEYPRSIIFEFDSLDDLRKFDYNYVEHTNLKIMHNISKVLSCRESEISDFEPIKEGLTNTSFVFSVSGMQYVYRHPGEGTEAIISRTHEKKALELAYAAEIDPTFVYMDAEEGWKISKFVKGIRTPKYDSFEDSKRVISVLKKLHKSNMSVDWSFMPWEEAQKIETILKSEKEGIVDPEYSSIKKNVNKCFEKCQGDGILPCFCHCDTYAPNWMFTSEQTILIDWEYAGNADPGCDLGTYIMDSMWDIPQADAFIKEYCKEEMNEKLRFHFLAYVAIVSFYWYVWALYREACGAIMGESLYNWRHMAQKYSQYLTDAYDL